MEAKQLNLIYFSATYTTKRVMKTIGSEWNGHVREYDITLDRPSDDIVFDKDEFVVFGAPVYAGRIPAFAMPTFQQFRGLQTPAVIVAVYGNRDYDDALLEIKDMVTANGFRVISAAAIIAQHSIFSAVGSQRPDNRDKELISHFARQSFALLEKISDTDALPDLNVKGNYPYKVPGKIPLKPKGDKTCNECGTCVRLCPVEAISLKKPRKTNTKICISCGRCVLICPQKSRKFGGLLYKIAGKKFVAANSERKEPESMFINL